MPTARPSIAIAVPSLNQGRFLPEALDSIARADVSVITAVLDAGSTDGSREIVEARSAEFVYWRSAPDGGQAWAINEGIIRLCEHQPDVDFVGWLNADDVFLKGGLQALVQALESHPDWVVACGRGALLSEVGTIDGEIPTEPFSRHRFARACTICQPATLIRRAAWQQAGGLDPSMHMCFDYDLWWRLSRLGTIGYVDSVVAASRDHGDTKTRRHREQYFEEATAIVHRETGSVPWHWYVSEAIERQVQYEVGRRPSFAIRVKARAEAAYAYVRGRTFQP